MLNPESRPPSSLLLPDQRFLRRAASEDMKGSKPFLKARFSGIGSAKFVVGGLVLQADSSGIAHRQKANANLLAISVLYFKAFRRNSTITYTSHEVISV